LWHETRITTAARERQLPCCRQVGKYAHHTGSLEVNYLILHTNKSTTSFIEVIEPGQNSFQTSVVEVALELFSRLSAIIFPRKN
jgi:hypothetical protein